MRSVVKGVAVAGLTATIAVPILRRRFKIPAAVTATALAAGPPSLAVVGRRTRLHRRGGDGERRVSGRGEREEQQDGEQAFHA